MSKIIHFKKNEFYRIKLFFNRYTKFNLKRFSIYYRNSSILYNYINSTVRVYNGKGWVRVFITKWNCGFKYGEFTWNRRRFKEKIKKKGKKK